jgi:hypothetical protein
MSQNLFNVAILLILIYEKIATIFWLKKNQNKLINYNKVKDYFILQRFVTYTSLANHLSILSAFYCLIFNHTINNIFFILTWNTLFSVTIGFWLLVYPKIIYSGEPYNTFLDFLAHGPVLVLYSLLVKEYNIIFTIDTVIYPILLGYFYLFFIWLPWYKLTGDSIYEAMDKRWNNRFLTIAKMNCIAIIGHLFAMCLFL